MFKFKYEINKSHSQKIPAIGISIKDGANNALSPVRTPVNGKPQFIGILPSKSYPNPLVPYDVCHRLLTLRRNRGGYIQHLQLMWL